MIAFISNNPNQIELPVGIEFTCRDGIYRSDEFHPSSHTDSICDACHFRPFLVRRILGIASKDEKFPCDYLKCQKRSDGKLVRYIKIGVSK